MRCNIFSYTEFGYFTLNKAIKCASYRLSTPRLNFLSLVFGQCIRRISINDCRFQAGKRVLDQAPKRLTQTSLHFIFPISSQICNYFLHFFKNVFKPSHGTVVGKRNFMLSCFATPQGELKLNLKMWIRFETLCTISDHLTHQSLYPI
jgi:hypothetical protein